MCRISLIATTVFLLLAGAAVAQASEEKSLPLDGRIDLEGRSVELTWFDAEPPRVGSVTVRRRLFGQKGAESWQTVGPSLGPVMRFTDDTIRPGQAYEYQVLRTARDIVDVGYWLTGVEVPAQEFRGNVHVIVDETVAEALAPRLERFARDLVGDGWRVSRKDVPRGDNRRPLDNLRTAIEIKTWLDERYRDDPFSRHAVVLVGHVPIIRSGRANPDGHEPVPHATDLFYADIDGRWRVDPDGALLDNRLPSDFIEMQIGRIDFSTVSTDRDRELHLLRSYFDKNHHWRMGLIGDLRNAYGQNGHLEVEQHGLRNIVGPDAVTVGGHHDVGETRPWLWGVDFGDWSGSRYAGDFANKAVFAINFGSGKQRIESPFNPMTALLAQPWYPVATGWGGRPAWQLHVMSLGGTIGDVHMRTVNNGVAAEPYRESMDYYPTGSYLWRNPVWVNLLGDPTLRPFMLAPPTGAVAEQAGEDVTLSWIASRDRDVIGYRVYRAAEGSADFRALNDGDLVRSPEFDDSDAPAGARYMIRTYGLRHVHAGSFFTYSQGAFAEVGRAAWDMEEMTMRTSPGEPVSLPRAFGEAQDGRIHAVIEGPATGTLEHHGTEWRYTPPEGFLGTVDLRVSVSDPFRTEERVLTILVGV